MTRLPLDELVVSVSESVEDPAWDCFLEGTPLGQYQQSSMWARYKVSEGWNPLRYIFSVHGKIVGGFQILRKETRLGRVGYLPKGPVFPDARPETIEYAADRLVHATQEHKLTALIAQPPDECTRFTDILKMNGFLDGKNLGIIEATLLIPINRDFSKVEGGMNRITRQAIRQAQKRGVSIREGDEQDLVMFFEMMKNTCRRQGTPNPNPSSIALFGKLWEAFHPLGRCRLTVAEHKGTVIAGLFCFIFGKRVTLWKKGWSGEGADLKPNESLYAEAFSWAHRNGFAWCDFGGLRRDIADSLLAGKPLTESQTKSRDMFNIRFGGIPKLMPQTMIYIKSKVIRNLFSVSDNINLTNKILRHFSY